MADNQNRSRLDNSSSIKQIALDEIKRKHQEEENQRLLNMLINIAANG